VVAEIFGHPPRWFLSANAQLIAECIPPDLLFLVRSPRVIVGAPLSPPAILCKASRLSAGHVLFEPRPRPSPLLFLMAKTSLHPYSVLEADDPRSTLGMKRIDGHLFFEKNPSQ